jgi:hypothetical protein
MPAGAGKRGLGPGASVDVDAMLEGSAREGGIHAVAGGHASAGGAGAAGESLGVGIIDDVSELIPLYHRYQHLRTLHRRLDTQ